MKTFSSAEMHALDRRTVETRGIPGIELMENAGLAVADSAERFLRSAGLRSFAVLAGRGNNGGDAFVAARILAGRGFPVKVFFLGPESALKGDALEAFRRMKLPFLTEFSARDLRTDSLIVDGLLGTGISGAPREPFATWIRTANDSGNRILAVDLPSGLNSDDGSASLAVRADLTVTMAAPKTGMILGEGPKLCGRIEVAGIGIEVPEESSGTEVFAEVDFRKLWKREPFDTFKNRRGHLFIVGGSREYPGAPFLAGEAALRSGAGLVTVLFPESAEILCAVPPSLIVRRIPDSGKGVFQACSAQNLRKELGRASAVAVGPGLTAGNELVPVLDCVFGMKKPMVVDADALNVISGSKLLPEPGTEVLLTPHPGEMKRLQTAFGLDPEKPRGAQALELAVKTGCSVLLKGVRTVVASPEGRFSVNLSGCPALASAGSGDVLTGLCGALMANGYSAYDAGRLGAYLHGRAGERLAGIFWRGITSADLAKALFPSDL